MERHVTECEDATVEGGHEVPYQVGEATMPLTGWFSQMLPVSPSNGALNTKMPPSLATSQ